MPFNIISNTRSFFSVLLLYIYVETKFLFKVIALQDKVINETIENENLFIEKNYLVFLSYRHV